MLLFLLMSGLIIATILILFNAGPLDVSWAVNSDKVGAILESFFPAQVNYYLVTHIIPVMHASCPDWW